MDDVMSGRNAPENLRVSKKRELRVEIGPWWQTIEFLPLGHIVEFSTV